MELNLTAKDGKIVVMGTSTMVYESLDPEDESEPIVKKARYSMELPMSEIPEEGELRADFTADKIVEEGIECDQPDSVTYKLKVSMQCLQLCVQLL